MTILGKILVIANLLFSLITGGLIVMVYAARTNWSAAYTKLEANVKVAQTNAQTYLQEYEELKKTESKKLTEIQAKLAQADTERTRVEAQNKTLSSRLDQLDKINKSATVNESSMTEELDRRTKEIALLKVHVDERDKKLLEFEKEKKEFRDRAVAAELNFKSEHDRNSNLLGQMETLHKEISKLQTSGGIGGPRSVTERQPPPEDVQGLVLESDQQTGLVTISIGSDAGLTRGNTLEVFRLQPEPKYLGTVQVLEVRADRAVVKLVTPGRKVPILVGDRVSSTILSKR